MVFEIAIFTILAILEIASIALIYTFKDVLHSVIALAMFFIFNSALFLIINQPLIALIQLFIMVGGIATYAFVGVSSSGYSKFKHTNYYLLVISSVLLFIAFAYSILNANLLVDQQNSISSSLIAQSIGPNIGLMYVMGLMLFGIGFGSIILMKKMRSEK